jgi:hexosaminidase
VPEIDSPAHTRSWGRSQKYENITLDCNGIYMGQFDPTIDLTWEVVDEVMSFIDESFDDEYVHLGGDETVHECWGAQKSITDWMANHNITDFEGLSLYYRERQKQLWRKKTNKKVIYWANEDIDLPMEDEDTVEWWGVFANVGQIVGRKNPVILANKDEVYLDFGFNNMYGVLNGNYADWRKAYGFKPRMENVNVIGGES